MLRRGSFRGSGCVLAAVVVASTARQAEAIEATPREKALSLACAEAKSVSFTARNTLPNVGSAPETLPEAVMRVVARKPSSLRVEVIPQPLKRPESGATKVEVDFHGITDGLLLVDGKNQYEYSPLRKAHSRSKPAKVLKDLDDRLSLCASIFADIIFDPKPGGYREVRRVTMDGHRARLYRAIFRDRRGVERYDVYVDPATRLPVRISQFLGKNDMELVETSRTRYSNWKLNPHIPPSAFRCSPPDVAAPPSSECATLQRAGVALNRLADAKSVEFTAKVSYPKPEAVGGTTLAHRWTFRVSARRPGSLRIEALPFPATRPSSEWGEPEDHPAMAYTTVITDGKKRIDIAPARREYQLSSAEPTLDQIPGQFAADLVPALFLFGKVERDFKRDGEAKIGTTAVHRYSLTMDDPTVKRTSRWTLYLDPKRRLPIRISEFQTDEARKTTEVKRADLSDFQFDRKFPAKWFDTTPPNGYRPGGSALPPLYPKSPSSLREEDSSLTVNVVRTPRQNRPARPSAGPAPRLSDPVNEIFSGRACSYLSRLRARLLFACLAAIIVLLVERPLQGSPGRCI